MKSTLPLQAAKHIPFPLSPEQKGVYDAVMSGASVSVNACAGSGKSHTARACGMNYNGRVESIPFMRALCDEETATYAGFNNVNPLNFHRRGLKLCGRVEVDVYKVNSIASKHDTEKAGGIAALVTAMKMEGYGIFEGAASADAIAVKYGIDTDLCEDAVKVLAESDADTATVDFADMLRFPVLQHRRETLEGLIILDEVQDYTPLAWIFVRDCLTTPASQVLMIGDPSRQMLMAFAGASMEIFDIMSNHFNCESHALTVNRRCSKAVVAAAPFKGEMVALDDAPEGSVESLPVAEVMSEIMEGAHTEAAVLSEANAPLVLMGLSLLTKGIACQMRSTKIEKAIKRVGWRFMDTRKFAVGTMAENCRKALQEAISEGTEDTTEKEDVIACIAALESYCLSKGIVKPAWQFKKPIHPVFIALGEMLNSKRGITLLTGHTAKGLEWNTVFHLAGKMKAPEQDWQCHQAACLAHVIATRARLRHVTLIAENTAKDD